MSPHPGHHLNVVPAAAGTTASAAPGTGSMDRRISRSPWQKHRRTTALAGLALLLAGAAWWGVSGPGGQSVRVSSDRLTLSPVTQGTFEDFIPVRGAVEPLTSIFLESVEGGRVEKRFVEAGQMVRAGDPIVELSNTDLQLEVISREAQVIEQLNQLRVVELGLETSRLTNRQQLVDVDYRIITLKRELDRRASLVRSGATSEATWQASQDEYDYQIARREVLRETRDVTDRLRSEQFGQLRTATTKLQENLEFARRNLDNLIVKAPVDGLLTTLEAEIGQTKSRGAQLGRVDRTDGFKIVAQVDEFYLSRMAVGQTAEAQIGSTATLLTVAKIFPQVRDGQFRVDLEFKEKAPDGVRPGQTLQLRLRLGDSTPALLIPNGAFFQDTGGDWLFVVDAAGTSAVKRRVQLGRRNTQVIEVRGGLQPGERVVTSAYGEMVKMDRITLSPP
jgi:HlyD family secretion protein